MLKIDFQDGRWISNRHNFGYIRSRGHPVATVLVSNQIAQWFGSRSQKLFFQDGMYGGHVGLPISMILVIFHLYVNLLLQRKFQLDSPCGLREDVQNRFLRWRLCRPAWIFDRHNFSSFRSGSRPIAIEQVSAQIIQGLRGSGEGDCKRFFLIINGHRGHLGQWTATILAIFRSHSQGGST